MRSGAYSAPAAFAVGVLVGPDVPGPFGPTSDRGATIVR